MIIDCIADLHGHYPKLEGGDLLIVAGDLTAKHTVEEFDEFSDWLDAQPYSKKVVIAGNHDDNFDPDIITCLNHCSYLCDSGTEFKGLKIWGSPWTKWFNGVNPKCTAFMLKTEEELAAKWALIPDDVDILVCHSPMWGLHDGPNAETRYGSTSLLQKHVKNHLNTLRLFVCGHIHEGYGIFDIREIQKQLCDRITTVYVNASHVNKHYKPVNKPVRVVL